ncbi:MAG TPA: hypothetical protein VFR71_06270 [Methyloceanibacter sp.]|nr:hypothetical protein [Methyloceanibacter sp.]
MIGSVGRLDKALDEAQTRGQYEGRLEGDFSVREAAVNGRKAPQKNANGP